MMIKTIHLKKQLLLHCMCAAIWGTTFAQVDLSKNAVESVMKSSPAFSIFKDNYFIGGTAMNEKPSKENSDIKFQFSFKQRLMNRPLIWGSYAYLSYTQKSFWDVFKKSSPFAETNYNPALQLLKPIYHQNRLLGILALSLEHESNGRDSINSRSWNFFSAGYTHFFSKELYASLRVWIPMGISDNPDLMHYIGYGEGQLTWMIQPDKLFLDITARKGSQWNSRGSLMTSLSFKPFMKSNQYIMIQWFQGYAESLIDYQKIGA